MTIFSSSFPRLPRGVRVQDLADNLKLYSDEEISVFKQQFSGDGRHRYYADASGEKQKLKYPVYVFEGKLFAVYPGKKYLLADGDSSFSRCKLAQNLETGEWVVDKTISIDADVDDTVHADVKYEQDCLSANHQDVLSDELHAVHFYRPFKDASLRANAHEEDGKYDIFMKYVHGMDLQEWLDHHPRLPLITRMNMSIGLVSALQSVHANGILHRDVKCRNAIFDMQKPADESVTLVDFGLSVTMDELHDDLTSGWGTPGYMAPEICYYDDQETGLYSVKSDIYALGVTLGKVWGLIDVNDGVMSFNDGMNFAGDFALKRCLLKLLRDMTAGDPEVRPSLDDLHLEFSKLRALLPEEFCVVKTVYVDAQDVRDAFENGEEACDHLLARLSAYDQVQLFDVQDNEPRMLLALKQALVNRGLVVMDEIYRGTLENIAGYVLSSDKCKHADSHIIDSVRLDKPAAQKLEAIRVATSEVPHVEQEVESYDWRDCLSWFFGNLADDARRSSQEFVRPAVDACGVGCFGFFSRPDTPEVERATNLLYEPLSDSDEETPRYCITMGRY